MSVLPDTAPAARRGVTLLLGIGGALLLLGALLPPSGDLRADLDRALGPVVLAAALVGPTLAPGRARAALALLAAAAAVTSVLLPILSVAPDEVQRTLGTLALWSRAVGAAAVGLALMLLDDDAAGSPDLALGAALAGAGLSALAVLSADTVLAVLTRGPVHVTLVLAAAATAAALVRLALTGPAPALLRFVTGMAGLLPLLGFLGTVLGIIAALASLPALFAAGEATDPDALAALLSGLATAFETTLIGLVAAAAVSFALTLTDTGDP